MSQVWRPVESGDREGASDRHEVLWVVAGACVVIFGLRYAEELLVPLLFAALVVALSSPILSFMLKKGLPAAVGAAAVLLIDLAALCAVGTILMLAAREMQNLLPGYFTKLVGALNRLALELNRHHVPVSAKSLQGALHLDQLAPVLGEAVGGLAALASSTAVVLLVAFFTLCELPDLGARLRKVSGRTTLGFGRIDTIARQIQRYLIVKTLVNLLVAVGLFVLLKVLGIQLALLLAVLVFGLHYIPNIGSMLATVAVLLVAYFDRGGAVALVAGSIFCVYSFVIGNVLEPRWLGRALGVSPLVVLLGLLFWGWLWGPLGALLAVPLVMVVKLTLENIPELAWIGELAEPSSTRPPPAPRSKSVERHSS